MIASSLQTIALALLTLAAGCGSRLDYRSQGSGSTGLIGSRSAPAVGDGTGATAFDGEWRYPCERGTPLLDQATYVIRRLEIRGGRFVKQLELFRADRCTDEIFATEHAGTLAVLSRGLQGNVGLRFVAETAAGELFDAGLAAAFDRHAFCGHDSWTVGHAVPLTAAHCTGISNDLRPDNSHVVDLGRVTKAPRILVLSSALGTTGYYTYGSDLYIP